MKCFHCRRNVHAPNGKYVAITRFIQRWFCNVCISLGKTQ